MLSDFLKEISNGRISVAAFLTVCGAILGFGFTVGGAMITLDNVNKKVNVMVQKTNETRERVSKLEGRMEDKNVSIRALSNQSAQNTIYINLLNEKMSGNIH